MQYEVFFLPVYFHYIFSNPLEVFPFAHIFPFYILDIIILIKSSAYSVNSVSFLPGQLLPYANRLPHKIQSLTENCWFFILDENTKITWELNTEKTKEVSRKYST